MDTRTTVAVVAVSAATALVVSLATWLVIEHRKPSYPAHERLCAKYDSMIADALAHPISEPSALSPNREASAAADAANQVACYR